MRERTQCSRRGVGRHGLSSGSASRSPHDPGGPPVSPLTPALLSRQRCPWWHRGRGLRLGFAFSPFSPALGPAASLFHSLHHRSLIVLGAVLSPDTNGLKAPAFKKKINNCFLVLFPTPLSQVSSNSCLCSPPLPFVNLLMICLLPSLEKKNN